VAKRKGRSKHRAKKHKRFEKGRGRRDHLEIEGTVDKVHAGGNFEVYLDNGATVNAQLSGRMRRFRIRVILGDRVKVAISPYDLTHGLIVYRMKETRAA